MSPALPHLTLVITAHREGALLARTLRSVAAAAEACARRGLRVEWRLVLDRPDAATEAAAAGPWPFLRRPDFVEGGSPGAARNHGVRLAGAPWVGFLDGDDPLSAAWLPAAHDQARRHGETVWVPERALLFGRRWRLVTSADSRSLCPHFLVGKNPWTALLVAPKELLVRVPFAETEPESGFGFEDWHWFAAVAARGVPIRPVPGTCGFYYRRPGSRFDRDRTEDVLLPPCPGLAEPRDAAAFPPSRRRRLRDLWPARLPPWIAEECRRLAIRPRPRLRILVPHPPPEAVPYGALVRAAPRPDRVLLVPRRPRDVTKIRELARNGRTAVVLTEPGPVPWGRGLPLVPFGDLAKSLGRKARRRLLATWLVQAGPDYIDDFGSALGREIFARHGTALRRRSVLTSS